MYRLNLNVRTKFDHSYMHNDYGRAMHVLSVS